MTNSNLVCILAWVDLHRHNIGGNEITLIDVLGTETDEVLDEVQLKLEKLKIYNRLQFLDEREQEVIRGRFGLPDGEEKTQREIAEELGISRSYVSRIEKRALTKLLHEFRPKRDE